MITITSNVREHFYFDLNKINLTDVTVDLTLQVVSQTFRQTTLESVFNPEKNAITFNFPEGVPQQIHVNLKFNKPVCIIRDEGNRRITTASYSYELDLSADRDKVFLFEIAQKSLSLTLKFRAYGQVTKHGENGQ